MIRLYISVEGMTERQFCLKIMVPYFMTRNVSITTVNMRGNVSLERACFEIRKIIHKCDIVTTFYDLYGFKRRNNRTKEELENILKDEINEPYKFIPYIQQYEFEALLFSDPHTTSRVLKFPDVSSELSETVRRFGDVEKINDGPHTCPSRRLINLFPSFTKETDGPNMCREIGIDRIRQECRGFNTWIEKIELLAQTKSRSS